jgi:superoxide dismutase, Fe-Mn family
MKSAAGKIMTMNYSIQPLAFDPASLDGLSAKLITSHHENNYGGAVKRLNAIRAELAKLDWAKAPGFTVGALKREELIAANSAFLHELYFDCLGARGALKPGGLSEALTRDFGSFERWCLEFSAVGKSLRGGSGWALCSWSIRANCLVNHWSADHAHLMAGVTPIIALDMYEHSYHMDYGANAEAYVEAFMRNIDWEKADVRYVRALGR